MLRCGFGWVMYHLLGLLVLLSLFRIIDTDHAEPRPHRLRGSRKRGYGGGGVGKAQLKRARNARDHGLEALRVAAEEGRLAAERQQAALEITHAAEFRARHAFELHDIVLVVFWGTLDSRATDEQVRHCGPTVWA